MYETQQNILGHLDFSFFDDTFIATGQGHCGKGIPYDS